MDQRVSCSRERHAHPVHLNRGRHAHIWVCLACDAQIAGPILPALEINAMIAFVKSAQGISPKVYKGGHYKIETEVFKVNKDSDESVLKSDVKRAKAHHKENEMSLEIKILAGAESKQFLVDFTKQLDRLERMTAGNKTAVVDETEEEEETAPKKKAKAPVDETEEEEDEDFGPKKKAAKKSTSFDEEEEEEETAPKKKKAKKLTIDDVNDACKARAAATGGKKGRAEVLAILKKKFKTETVSEIDEDRWAECIEAMEID